MGQAMRKEDVTEELAAEVERYREGDGLDVRSISDIMDISMQDVTEIINSDVYKEARVEKGPSISGFSEGRRQEILDRVDECGLEFSETEHFEGLTDEQKRHSEVIVRSFANLMYSYYLLEPDEWHEKTLEGGLEECCTWLFPRKIVAEESLFESVAPVLAAFFSFAGDEGLVKHPQTLVRRVQDIGGKIVEGASDPRNWSMAKSMMMAAKDAGVDLEDERELRKFFQSLGMQPLDTAGEAKKHWTRGEVEELSTEQIIKKLQEFRVDFDEEQFLEDVGRFYSAAELADRWREKHPVTAAGPDEDFIPLAAATLWERLAPDVPNAERVDEKMRRGRVSMLGFNHDEACSLWLDAWELIKRIKPPEVTTLVEMDDLLDMTNSVQDWCDDMEMELRNAGRHRELIGFVHELFETFPDRESGIIDLNMRKAEADSHFELGNFERGEEKYEELTEEHPDNVFGYLCWGDQYHFEGRNPDPDHDKAEDLYLAGLENAVKRDIEWQVEAALDRLSDLYGKTGEPEKIEKIEERYGIS